MTTVARWFRTTNARLLILGALLGLASGWAWVRADGKRNATNPRAQASSMYEDVAYNIVRVPHE
jgi:predicted negative regulator of RcsB-dependent stress response